MAVGGEGDFLSSPLCCTKAPRIFSCFPCILPFPSSPTVRCFYTVPFSFKLTFCALIPAPLWPREPAPGVWVSTQPRGVKRSLFPPSLQPRTLAGVPAASSWEKRRHFPLLAGPRMGNSQDPAAGWLCDLRVGSARAGSGLRMSPQKIMLNKKRHKHTNHF